MFVQNNNEKQESFKKLDIALLVVVILMVVFLMTTLGTNLFFQYTNYSQGISIAAYGDSSISANHAVILAYARAWDFAIVKTSTLFLGFILVFVGALYLLRTVEMAYSLTARSSDKIEMGFSTTSPGLVLSTLGVIIIIVLLFTKTEIRYEEPIIPNLANEERSVIGDVYVEEEMEAE